MEEADEESGRIGCASRLVVWWEKVKDLVDLRADGGDVRPEQPAVVLEHGETGRVAIRRAGGHHPGKPGEEVLLEVRVQRHQHIHPGRAAEIFVYGGNRRV